MEESLYQLQLDYLMLAREMVLGGQEQKAMFSLGLTPEAVAILKKLPAQKVREIAQRECVAFTPRFNASYWSCYLLSEQPADDKLACEYQARDLLILITGSGNAV
ncbi:flagellar transcriptional regulator FlhD [Methylomonas sp. BW4-1]|uniref:flagellar transcriptional regulator FlhD n=1 Tax=Methylomonas sp. BW4-1 TaxID=3376685 RepID=UPI004041337A